MAKTISFRPNRKYKKQDTVFQVLAYMKYCERLGKDILNPGMKAPKSPKYWNTLHKRKQRKDCMGNLLDNNAPF